VSGRRPPKRVVVVDWDTRNLRVVHARVQPRALKIERVLAARIPPEVDPADPQQMGTHLQRVLQQEGITTRYAIADVPRDQVVLNTLHLPVVAPEELPGMVQIQIAKELSFPVSEAVVDFTLGPRAADGNTTDVLVAAVRTEVVRQWEATFEAAGLKLLRLGLRPHASKVAICRMLSATLPQRVVFIDVRPTFTEVDVLKEGHLVFSRAASVMVPEAGADAGGLTVVGADEDESRSPRGGLTLNLGGGPSAFSTESAVSALVVELTRSLEAYRARDPGARIDHVVIGGDTGIEERLGEVIGEKLGIPTELYNPASTFGWEPDEGAAASGFSAGLGLVLCQSEPEGLHYDFLHPRRMVSQTREKLRKAPLVGAVVVLFVASAVVFSYESTAADRKLLADKDKRISELKSVEDEYDDFLNLTGLVQAFDTQQFVWVDLLQELLSVLPSNEEMVLEAVEMSHDKKDWRKDTRAEGRIVLKTRTKNRDTALQVIDALEAYRRQGQARALFKVSMGTQSEKKGEAYGFSQDLTVQLLSGALPPGKGPSEGAGAGASAAPASQP